MRVRLGAVAVCLPMISAVAGEPIILGTQRISPDPQETARIEKRTEATVDRARLSSPFTDDFGTRAMFVPLPVEPPKSRRDQNARDEKLNWMMLDRGDLTDATRSDEPFGVSPTSLEKDSGRRDFFFTKPDGRESAPDNRLPNSRTPYHTDERTGQPSRGILVPTSSGKRVDDDKQRDKSSSSSDSLMGIGPEANSEREETGLGPLVNPARVSGGQAFERWSSSLNEVARRRSEDGTREAQERRDQYLGFLDNPQYGGASYPVNKDWGKYQREWMGSGTAARQNPGLRPVVSGTGGRALTESLQPMMPSSGASSPTENRLNAPQGNLSGVGNLPSYLQDRRPPSSAPRPDYSVPKSPGRGFNF